MYLNGAAERVRTVVIALGMRRPAIGRQPQRKILVPLTGFEPVFPLNREADPESAASASSATGVYYVS